MKRPSVLLVVVGVLLASMTIAGPAQARTQAKRATFTMRRYKAQDTRFSRNYWTYVPSRKARSTPLVVYLHGCIQGARDAAIGSRWNDVAERYGFVAAFPDEDTGKDPTVDPADRTVRSLDGSANGTGCWNWYHPADQSRGAGEPATIAGITRAVMRAQHIDPRRVYVIGASAGADMAEIMGATYPDLYAAIGVLAGCAYMSCTDVTGAAAHAAMGTHARVMPVFAVQGTADNLNAFPLGAAMVQQWLGTDDLADNGSLDGSVPRSPASFDHYGVDETALAGVGSPGDLCVRNMHWPCPGGALGFKRTYPYSIAHFLDAHGRSLIDFWIVHGAGHAYLSGRPDNTFTDPLGPDITMAAYRFFSAHPKPKR